MTGRSFWGPEAAKPPLPAAARERHQGALAALQSFRPPPASDGI